MKDCFKGILIALAVLVFCLFKTGNALAIDYTITDLGTLGGTKSEAWGINNLDEVVGRAYLAGDINYHAFLYSGGVMMDLGISNCTDPYGKSFAFRINDSGQIAGLSCFWVPGNFTRAFLYSEGVMGDLGTLGGSQSEARGINNSGHVVGSAALGGDAVSHAFVSSGGVMTNIGTLGSGTWSWAFGINDSDQIVGESRYSPSTFTHAFLYSGGVMTDLTPVTPGSTASAYDINNLGQIVGAAAFPGTDRHAFLYSQGVLTDLGSFGGPVGSEAWGINNFGQIVGWSYIPYACYGNCVPRAFLYKNGVMTDLNSLLPPNSGWELNYALDINDKGRIVGVGKINGQSHAFLMVPQTDKIGVFRNGSCYLDYNGNGVWNSCTTDVCISFGLSTDIPVVGDWNGDGYTEIGVKRGANWYLDYNGNDAWDGCGTTSDKDRCYNFGLSTDIPISGDWNNSGTDKIGVFRNGSWYLDYNGNGVWNGCMTDICIPSFGLSLDIPVVGDWNGDGYTEIGVFRNGKWYLDYDRSDSWSGCGVDECYTFGMSTDMPVVGDWNGSGFMKIGVKRGIAWYLDYNGNGAWNSCTTDRCYSSFGLSADKPLVGNW